jgi:hypothetical protein
MKPTDLSGLSEDVRRVHIPHPQVFRYPRKVELIGYLPSWRGSHIHELANSLRLGTVVPN